MTSDGDGTLPPQDKDELARRLGYVSYLSLFEASQPVPTSDGRQWFVTPGGEGRWAAWNETDTRDVMIAETKEAAIDQVPRTGGALQAATRAPAG